MSFIDLTMSVQVIKTLLMSETMLKSDIRSTNLGQIQMIQEMGNPKMGSRGMKMMLQF